MRSTRRSRRSRRLRKLLLLAALAGGAYLFWRPTPAALRAEQARLHERWGRLAAQDPFLARPLDSDLALGVPRAYTQKLAEQAAAHLLRRVPLSLKGLRFQTQGEVEKKVLLAKLLLGRWRLDVRIVRLEGLLRGGVPRVRYARGERLELLLPVAAESGTATGRLRFAWNSHGLANALCKDFALDLPVTASLHSEAQPMAGELRLSVEGETVRASPSFEKQALRVRVEPSAATWAAARRALEAQDSFWKCGVGLRPDDVIERLRELTAAGFPVKLPGRALRPLRIPASFELTIGRGAPLGLAISPSALRVERGALWYGAHVEVRRGPLAGRAEAHPVRPPGSPAAP